jgi:hypothetical protein
MDLTALLQAQPKMHTGTSGQPFSWQLANDLLRFIDVHVRAGAKTLEIGAGVSTILFALKGTRHRCIVPAEEEVTRIKAFCRDHGISLESLTFEIDRSERCLPRLDLTGLDFVLIDGAHGFPLPFLDWYYSADRLKVGGLLAIDDTEIWTGYTLKMFLMAEPEWKLEADYGPRSVVFRKLQEGGLGRNEWDQPYVVEQTLNFMFAKYPDDVDGLRPYVRHELFAERARWARLRRIAAGCVPGPIKRRLKRALGL